MAQPTAQTEAYPAYCENSPTSNGSHNFQYVTGAGVMLFCTNCGRCYKLSGDHRIWLPIVFESPKGQSQDNTD